LWAEGESLLKQAMKLEPSVPEPHRSLGLLEFRRDDLPAEDSLRRAVKLFEHSIRLEKLEGERCPATHTLLGATYQSLGETDRAEAEFRIALDIDPQYEEALFNLATLRMESDPDEASSFFQRAIEIDPQYGAAYRELGVLFQKQGKFEEGEYHLRRALELDPADYWAQMYLANLLALQGKNTEAEQTYRFATTLHPEIKEGTEIFARFLDSLGKQKEAAIIRGHGEPG
ncbi:MAG TPA: tetratricopeptide repeat protein, partial [Candidatus Sulfotelmatobacter sp.]|nr:tetratricopeptide repeat protein [Candidatus Sulfotelmatobacter sp.]